MVSGDSPLGREGTLGLPDPGQRNVEHNINPVKYCNAKHTFEEEKNV